MQTTIIRVIFITFVLSVAFIFTAEAVQSRSPQLLYPSSKRIVIFVADGWGYCTKAESYFATRNIPFESRDIQKSHQFYREWHDHFHGDIVPLTVFDNGKFVIDGFDPKAINHALRAIGISTKNR